MNLVMMKGAFFGLFGSTLLLVGCGGGGGGGGGETFTPPNISNTPVTIDSNNQYEVAATAGDGITGTVEGSTGAIGVVVGGSGQPFSAFEFVEKTVLGIGDEPLESRSQTPTGLEIASSCDLAPNGSTGSSTLTTNAEDFLSTRILTAGDYVSISYSNCYDADDAETNSGKTTMSIVSGALNFNLFDPLSGTLSIAVNFENMRSAELDETSVMHGDVVMTINGGDVSMSGDSVYVMTVGGEAAHMTNFSMSSTTTGNTETTIATYTIASTEIDGVITVRTDPSNPILQDLDADNPHAGTLIITGGATTLTMIVTSTTEVSLSLDSDSNGTPDAGYPVTVTWTEIEDGAANVL